MRPPSRNLSLLQSPSLIKSVDSHRSRNKTNQSHCTFSS